MLWGYNFVRRLSFAVRVLFVSVLVNGRDFTKRAIIDVNSIVSGRNYDILDCIIAQLLTSRPFLDPCQVLFALLVSSHGSYIWHQMAAPRGPPAPAGPFPWGGSGWSFRFRFAVWRSRSALLRVNACNLPPDLTWYLKQYIRPKWCETI